MRASEKPLALQTTQGAAIEPFRIGRGERAFLAHEIRDLGDEPGVDSGEPLHFVLAFSEAQRIGEEPQVDAVPGFLSSRRTSSIAWRPFTISSKPRQPRFEAAQGFLQRLLERSSHGHRFADPTSSGSSVGSRHRETSRSRTWGPW